MGRGRTVSHDGIPTGTPTATLVLACCTRPVVSRGQSARYRLSGCVGIYDAQGKRTKNRFGAQRSEISMTGQRSVLQWFCSTYRVLILRSNSSSTTMMLYMGLAGRRYSSSWRCCMYNDLLPHLRQSHRVMLQYLNSSHITHLSSSRHHTNQPAIPTCECRDCCRVSWSQLFFRCHLLTNMTIVPFPTHDELIASFRSCWCGGPAAQRAVGLLRFFYMRASLLRFYVNV